MESTKKKNWVKVILKWLGIVIGGILLLLVILWFVLQTRWAQNIVRGEVVSYLEKKLDTKVAIEKLSINYLYHLELNGVYVGDQSEKTLVYIGKLEAGYKLLDLLDNTLTVSSLSVDSLQLNVYNQANDSLFNYDFIAKAFASEDTTAVDTLSGGTAMKFNIGDINLSRANIKYHDAFYGQNIDVNFRKIDIAVNEFNLDSMIFSLDHLYTENLFAGIQFNATPNIAPQDTTSGAAAMPRIKADSISLSGTRIVYIDEKSSTDLNTVAEKLGISGVLVNLDNNEAQIKNLQLSGHTTSFVTSAVSTQAAKPADTTSEEPFKFDIGQITLADNNISYDDNSKARVRGPQLDFAHIKLQDLNTQISNIASDGSGYKADIKNLEFTEQSGFQLKKLQTNASYTENQVRLTGTVIQTNRSYIAADVDAQYASLQQASDNPGHVALNVKVKNTKLVLNDLLFFQPELAKNEYVKPLLGKEILLNSNVTGKVNNLNIASLTIREGAVNLDASARVTGLPDSDKMKIDLKLNRFSGTRSGLLALLPPDLIPASVHLPDQFNISGTYNGTTQDMLADLKINTTSGNISVKGNIRNASDSLRAVYTATVFTDDLDLNKFLGDTSLGKLSVNLDVKGRGYAVKTADIALNGKVNKLEAMGYTYSDLTIEGKLANNKVTANLNSPDSNLLADINISYDMDESNPQLVATSNDMRINLKALGFSEEHLVVKGKLDADLANADPDKLDGSVFITGLQIAHKDRVYPLDSLKVIAGRVQDSTDITIETPLLAANMRGLYKLTTVAQTVQAVMAHYTSDSAMADTSIAENQFRLTGTVMNHAIVRSFVPDIRNFTPLQFAVNLDSRNYLVDVKAGMKNLRYADFVLDSLNIDVNTENDSLLYSVSLNEVRHPSMPLNYTHIYGGMLRGRMGWNLDLLDREDEDKYFIGGTYDNIAGMTELRLLPELLINKQTWTTNADNVIQIDSNGIHTANLELMRNGRGLSIIGAGESSGFPITVNFTNFSIATIAAMLKSDTLFADGLINGTVKLDAVAPIKFIADLTVDSIKAMSQPIGTLAINASSPSPDIYNVNAELKGDSVDLTVKGDYRVKGDDNLNFDVNIPEFSLAAAQPFVRDIVGNLKGMVTGNLTLRGNASKPVVRGSLGMKDASLVYLAYGTGLRIPDETIVFDEQGILLDKFTITDSSDNTAVIDGRVFTTDYAAYRFDLTVNTRNFRAIDNRLNPEQMIYGPASIDARLTVKGDMNLPVIEGNVRVRDNSSVTVVLPSEDPQVESRRGIIRFVDLSNPIDSSLLAGADPKDSVAEEAIKGISLSISAQITPESSMTIVLDEQNGDSLRVNGNATINMTIDPSGKTSMTGRYTVSEGSYILSLNQFIKRRFEIVKDGTITWTGDPTSATLDLSALYVVETTAEPLLNGAQNVPAGTVRQKFPFEVYLDLDGEMLQPQIGFRLDMPERERNAFDGVVYNRISQINNDESELNKQVMGLLVLNNFIGDNPFSSLQGGNSTESMAKGAAGKILAQQLNNLAGDLIKGVDVNFDFEQREDYTSGVRDDQTNLNVGLSKNLFNDRTTVTVGSSVPVEGSNQNTSGLTGNVTIEYKITRDGRYRLKIYRRNDNQTIVDGEVIETGVGFTLVMDYNEFREIFEKSKRRRYRANMDRGPRTEQKNK